MRRCLGDGRRSQSESACLWNLHCCLIFRPGRSPFSTSSSTSASETRRKPAASGSVSTSDVGCSAGFDRFRVAWDIVVFLWFLFMSAAHVHHRAVDHQEDAAAEEAD